MTTRCASFMLIPMRLLNDVAVQIKQGINAVVFMHDKVYQQVIMIASF